MAHADVSLVGVDDDLTDAIGRRLSERDDLDVIPVSAARELPWGYFVSGTRIVSKGHDQSPEQAEVLGDLAGITHPARTRTTRKTQPSPARQPGTAA